MPAERHEPTREGAAAKPYDRPCPPTTDNDLSGSPAKDEMTKESTLEELKVHPDWTEGDFTLVSSDGVAFRVQSYYLYAASSVFRNAAELASKPSKRMEFTDKDIETECEITKFLEIATGKKPSISEHLVSDDDDHDFYKFILFLKKWELETHLHIVLLQLRDWARTEELGTFPIWGCGAVAGDMDTCQAALKNYKSRWMENIDRGNDPSDITESKLQAYVFDPSGWPSHVWIARDIPPLYLCALARAFGQVGATPQLGPTFKKMFEKYWG